MFIANVPEGCQAPLGAACDNDRTARGPMPLLTELERYSAGLLFYKHAAPSGAFVQTRHCGLAGQERRVYSQTFSKAA
jgi:hypothetical protein